MTAEEKIADNAIWIWEELRCPSGHVIPKSQKR